MIVATAGHVDHGKTSLVKALTGVDTDRLAEEKARGLTIELGFAYRRVDDSLTLGFVDVPGHEKFVHTMLAGAGGVDFALLVVAADDGPMPQTIEHLAILDLLGLGAGCVALTKVDRVPAQRIDAVRAEIDAMLASTRLAGADVLPVCSLTGAGMAALEDYLIDTAKGHQGRRRDRPFRMAVDRAFTLDGTGLVVTGTAVAGEIRIGDHAVIAPDGLEVRVRGIHGQNEKRSEGGAGDRLGLNIAGTGVDKQHIGRGDWLVAAGRCRPTSRFDVALRVLATEARPLSRRQTVHLHIGAADVLARVAVLDGQGIAPGGDGLVQLVTERPVMAFRGDRVIVRDRSAKRTVGGGEVIDPFAPDRQARTPDRVARLSAMAAATADEALARLLALAPEGVVGETFAQAWNLAAGEIEASAIAAGAVRAGANGASVFFGAGVWSRLGVDLAKHLAAFHEANPTRAGIGVEALRRRHFNKLPAEVFRSLLAAARDRGDVRVWGSNVAAAGHYAVLAPADEALWRRLEPLLEAAGRVPPRYVELEHALGVPLKDVKRCVAAAARLGLAHPVAANRAYLPETLLALAETAEKLSSVAEGHQFAARAFRDASGLGRNLAIDVLEYFDHIGFTRRFGDLRVINGPARDHVAVLQTVGG